MSNNLTPQELPAEDLGDLTAPPVRGAGLSGLLDETPDPPPASPASPAVSAGDTASPADTQDLSEQDEVVTPIRPLTAARTPSPRKPGRPRTRTKPTSAVYVSDGVKKRFEKYRHDKKSTNLQVILEAISAKHRANELDQIIKESKYSTAPVSDLFPADPSSVRYLGGGSSQIAFSLTEEQEAKIDEIGKKLGFETRSTWIAPILNSYLPGKKEKAH
ncbi:hypothetical protein A5722_01370 [Mycobacterium vulneris]|uniref:Uncharacterized protein n=1 Tax=Mycolicibacterium septicum DSM 44393 TaxID=1341646 RepID=A0A7X6MVU8_9MYCO|nr:hypothetical protein [Mycolicibacterium fortuitum]MBX8687821.1 hypothetical protein [Mycobacterium sp. 20091114027_K0903767]MCP3810756.1 hypothetical protein [Mycobacteriaceae bacterium Msp059]NKZ14986.1 hypothetical protein [Mycolicibacterium septicum DSM 44393]OCB48700.1 hypothetical protein A5721_04635 [Mycolicibacterium vulneris]OBK04514.1 hypothetical protein A5637_11930 [Mycolicibacterium fortuitum]